MADPIFNLVKSLTKQEKIFFKRQAEISGRKEPTYIKLFNAMDSMDEYEEAKLRKKLKNPPWWKRIGYERLYLKNALLDSLSIYNSNRKTTDPIATVEAQVKRELNHVQVLREKHQTELALKLINMVIEDAAKHELYSYWQMALH